MSSIVKKIIIIVVILVLGYLAYSMFFKTSEDDQNLISGTNSLNGSRDLANTQLLGNQITQALIQIESLTLDRSIFENEIFNSLNDRSEQITPEPVGRSNPFAPLDDTSVNFNSNTPTIKTSTSTSSNASDEQSSNVEEGSPFGDLGL